MYADDDEWCWLYLINVDVVLNGDWFVKWILNKYSQIYNAD